MLKPEWAGRAMWFLSYLCLAPDVLFTISQKFIFKSQWQGRFLGKLFGAHIHGDIKQMKLFCVHNVLVPREDLLVKVYSYMHLHHLRRKDRTRDKSYRPIYIHKYGRQPVPTFPIQCGSSSLRTKLCPSLPLAGLA